MSDTITGLLVSEESKYQNYVENYRNIRNAYLSGFKEFIDQTILKESEMLEDEKKIVTHIQEMIESSVFQYMIGNNIFRDRLLETFDKDYFIGNSKQILLGLESNIENLCDTFSHKYEEYVDETSQQIENNLKQIDSKDRKEIDIVIQNNLYSEKFYNELVNAKLI